MEIIGRFPTAQESQALKISPTVPIWLPADNNELAPEVKRIVKSLRNKSKCSLFMDSLKHCHAHLQLQVGR